ncbi:MAG TPA: hypothetical protein VM865_06355 [Acidobacteriaceae bacterium]|nr:hypothetical protein [Acidobacteriaceae bacterium]
MPRRSTISRSWASRLLLCAASLALSSASLCTLADPVPAKYKPGSTHAFVLLKSEDGKILAVGDQINVVTGNQVRGRLVFHFRDGSIDDEITVFRQDRVFQLISDHHIQKGPSFPQPTDIAFNVPSGQVTWHEFKDGKDQVHTDHMDLPPDLSNGLMSTIVDNFPSGAPELKVSYVAGDPKPRIVKLSIKPEAPDHFFVAGSRRRCTRYNIHIELGGIAGVVAPVVGKQPSDIQVWVTDGEVPTFLKMVGALYQKGPLWTMVQTNASWPSDAGASTRHHSGR